MGYLFAMITVLLWASFVILGRLAGAHHLNAFDLTALRFGVAALMLLPLCFWHRPPALFSGRMLFLSLVGGLGYALVAYGGLYWAPASHGAILLSGVLPFFMCLMAYFVLREKPTRHDVVALLVIAAGVLSLAKHSLHDLRLSWRGDVLMLAGSASWAIYTVYVKRWNFLPWDVTRGVALWSAFLYLPVYYFFLPKNIQEAAASMIVLQGVFHGFLVVIVAMMLYMKAMQSLGPTHLGAVMATVPAVAGMGAVFLLNEPLTLWLVAGLCLTSAGACMAALQPAK